MDDRQIQLKNLKKAYLKERRRAMWGWDLLWFLLLALLLVAVATLAYMVFYKTAPVRILDIYVWTPIKQLVGIRQNLLFVGTFVLKYAKWFILGFGVLFLLVWLVGSLASLIVPLTAGLLKALLFAVCGVIGGVMGVNLRRR